MTYVIEIAGRGELKTIDWKAASFAEEYKTKLSIYDMKEH